MVEGTGPRPIVLCADDYGLNAGVNSAILDLAHRGRISATSCMTNAPAWPEAARALRALDGRIGIGLHLTLTLGAPLGPMPRLAPGGLLPPLGRLMRASALDRILPAEIVTEAGRQLDAFEAAFGRPPDFVDGHQHVHVLRGIRRPLLLTLKARGLAQQIWLRDPADRFASILARRLAAPKAVFVRALATRFRRDAAQAGFPTNVGFSGFSPFDPVRPVGPDIQAYLMALGPRPLVMCHPGAPCGDTSDPIAAARAAEAAYLGSPDFERLLGREAVALRPSPV